MSDLFFLCGPEIRGHVSAPPHIDFERCGEFVGNAFVQHKMRWFEKWAALTTETGRTKGVLYLTNDGQSSAQLCSAMTRLGLRSFEVELTDGLGEKTGTKAQAFLVDDDSAGVESFDGYGRQWVFHADEQGGGVFGPHFFDFRKSNNTGWFAFDLTEAENFVRELNQRSVFVHTLEAYVIEPGDEFWKEPTFGSNWYYGGGTVFISDVEELNSYVFELFDKARIDGRRHRFEIYPDIPNDWSGLR